MICGFVVTLLLWCFRELTRNRKHDAFHNMSAPGLVLQEGYHGGSDIVVGNPVPGHQGGTGGTVLGAKTKDKEIKVSAHKF